MIDLEKLPKLLRSLRTRTGRTQVDVAAQAGVPQANLSRWESGKVRPSLESLIAVLNALDLDFRDLQDSLDEAAAREAAADAPDSLTASRLRRLSYFGRSMSDPFLSILSDIDRRIAALEEAVERHFDDFKAEGRES